MCRAFCSPVWKPLGVDRDLAASARRYLRAQGPCVRQRGGGRRGSFARRVSSITLAARFIRNLF